MKKKKYVTLPTYKISLIESMRSIGHSMETAVADIIDNSITAKARNLWIDYSWAEGSPFITITDDGCGMSEGELHIAMQFGSSDPKAKRLVGDLGRFGLGLKTASISQCRRFTVVTRKNNIVNACVWDYDDLEEDKDSSFKWMVEIIDSQELSPGSRLTNLLDNRVGTTKSGTVVLWENLDRLSQSGGPSDKERQFNRLMSETRKHLELVFHRFLSTEPGHIRFRIFINDDELVPFNPFNVGNNATQELPLQSFTIDGEPVRVQPYILPHPSKVSQTEWDRFEGDSGYVNNQGFYIYRSRRLILAGTWFRLLKKLETNKLIRIRVDIPNSLDHLWKIDVKKSGVVPPEAVLKELRQIINKIESAGKVVFRHRGQKLLSSFKIPVWNRRIIQDKDVRYEINREYPLLHKLYKLLSSDEKKRLDDYLTVVERSYPATLLYNDISDNPKQEFFEKYDEETLEKLVDIVLEAWSVDRALDIDIINQLFTTDPFGAYPELTRDILVRKGLLK
jgi:hypothetical protein